MLTDRLIVAQSVLFLVAGYDTTASTLAMTSFLLAKNPIHQQRLRQEMQQIVEEHGNITYHSIMEAKFLDACLMGELKLLLNVVGVSPSSCFDNIYSNHLDHRTYVCITEN